MFSGPLLKELDFEREKVISSQPTAGKTGVSQ